MQEQKIKCPSCDTEISIDEVMTRQIKEKIKKELGEENRLKEVEIIKQKEELEDQKNKLEEAQKNTQIEVNKKVAEKLGTEKITLWKKAQTEAEKQKVAEIKILEEQIKVKDEKLIEANTETLNARTDRQKLESDKRNFELEKSKQIEAERKQIETDAFARAVAQSDKDLAKLQQQIKDVKKAEEDDKKLLKEQLAEKEAKLQEANEKELEVRRDKNKLEEDKKNFELDKQRQLDDERKTIAEEAGKKASEEQQYVIAQLKKQLTDATKAKDDLARKLEQGSQQTQGEVLELELEELLKQEFTSDEIVPVPKGVKGADVIHKVKDRSGRLCGQIVWESKKTKAWSEGWVQKLKDDQRLIKAELAVIVSAVLPDKVKGFIFRNGVWICDIKMAIALATALRINLKAIAHEKTMAVGKNEKVEILYSYLTGVEFKQRVEAIVEAFTGMQDGLNKEKRAFEKIWAEREKQIQKVISNTVGMYGDLNGLVALPQIKMLELEDGEEKGEQDNLFTKN